MTTVHSKEVPMDERLREHLPTFERFFESIGFKPRLGRLWGFMVLSGRPLSSADIAHELNMSIGSTSESLTELREWGAITSEFSPQHRCHLHSAVSDTMSIVVTVLRRREQVAIARFKDSAANALGHVQQSYGKDDPRVAPLQSIVSTSEIAEAAIQFFVAASSGLPTEGNTRLNRLIRRLVEIGIRVPTEVAKRGAAIAKATLGRGGKEEA